MYNIISLISINSINFMLYIVALLGYVSFRLPYSLLYVYYIVYHSIISYVGKEAWDRSNIFRFAKFDIGQLFHTKSNNIPKSGLTGS